MGRMLVSVGHLGQLEPLACLVLAELLQEAHVQAYQGITMAGT